MINNIKKDNLMIEDLTCNYLKNPLGVDSTKPRLSWKLKSDIRGQKQTAYRILVSGSNALLDADKADLWDTGKVELEDSIFVIYQGKRLKSRQGCFWKVCVWDKDGNCSSWSDISYFEMGLLNQNDWLGKWICAPYGGTNLEKSVAAPIFRKTITLESRVKSARAYVCGIGYHELYINGKKIGNEVLAPAYTQYDKRVLYNTYDIGKSLKAGENAIGFILGNGWYNCFTSEVWGLEQASWKAAPKLIAQIYITFENGKTVTILSDGEFKVSKSAIIFDGLRNGEYYDARLEKNGWNKAGFNDRFWRCAKITTGPGGTLKSSQMTPIRVTDTIEPVKVKRLNSKSFVYDLEQNISGWAKIRVAGHAGTKITMKYAEVLNLDGTVDQSHIGKFIKSGQFQTDSYILKGEGIEEWEPRFTYHGFRYIQVQVTGCLKAPEIEEVVGRVVHTDFEKAGDFSCSNELLNKIQSCVKWSTLTNFHGIPTDCPQREKMGWTGDAHLSSEQTMLNFYSPTAYIKWLRDFIDAQRPNGHIPGTIPTASFGYNWGSGPAWDSALFLIPWYLYLYYGDSCLFFELYNCMKKYLSFLNTMANNYIVDYGLGDWNPPVGGNFDHKCPVEVTDTAYYYTDALILSKIARLLGKTEDEKIYIELADNIRKQFCKKFYNKATGGIKSNCQTSQACGLYHDGLLSDDKRSLVCDRLVELVKQYNNHVDCGILGTKYLLRVLTDMSEASLAYSIATQTTFPSWGDCINRGATTLWANWRGDGSLNHHMFSDVSTWFYECLAGIKPDENLPGFKHIVIKPNPIDGLTFVNAWHMSMYGIIKSCWRIEGEDFILDISVPIGCTATVYLPIEDIEKVSESGHSVKECQSDIVINSNDNGRIAFQIVSGDYSFKAKM